MSDATMEAGRELDELVAEQVMGLRVERIKPDWYPVEVALFFRPGNPLVEYSLDERSCNARMFRNGVDEKDGTAPPLPFYSEEIEHAWEVMEKLRESGDVLSLNWYPDAGHWECVVHRLPHAHGEATTVSLAICLAALASARRARAGGEP